MRALRSLTIFLALAILGGCRPEPVPIRYGEDACAHCLMTVSDARYGTQLVTMTGRTYAFDSVECLAAFLAAEPEVREQVHSLWVTGFDAPERLIPVEEAFFLHSPTLRSPMGMNLTAFGAGVTPDSALNAFGGEVLDWAGVLALVEQAAPASHAHHPAL